MNGVAYYKEAGSDVVRKVSGRIVPYRKGLCGFIISGFSDQRYVIVDEKEDSHQLWMGDVIAPKEEKETDEKEMKKRYVERFEKFHRKLTNGELRKIVLSRRRWEKGEVDVTGSFEKACKMYKDQTVALISSEVTGAWLVATPELLLEMSDGRGGTIALAGTMRRGEGEWTEKNREEQRLVAEYIGKRLQSTCDIVEEGEAYTVQAGELLHLRSEFRFATKKHWEEVARALHPTPAVCGLPAAEAYDFISGNEGYRRTFYSGYFGPGDEDSCALYVTLRCAEITAEGYWLYAGGGIMPESDAESEWNETENKMETIKRCIVTR